MQKAIVQHAVAERKNWAKFGRERGNKPGPDRSTTTVGENIQLKLSAGNKVCCTQSCKRFCLTCGDVARRDRRGSGERTQSQSHEGGCWKGSVSHMQRSPLHIAMSLQGDDWRDGRSQWPGYAIVSLTSFFCHVSDALCLSETPPFEEEAPAPAASAGGKYVPPSMRAGGTRLGESMGRPGGRDGLPTVRISNLSKDASDSDVRELLAGIGRPARVHIVQDHVTKLSKGFAFVSWDTQAMAQATIDRLNGKGYDNLILNVSITGKSKVYSLS